MGVLGALPRVKEMRRLINPVIQTLPVNPVAEKEAQTAESIPELRHATEPPQTVVIRPRANRKHFLYPANGNYDGIASYEEAIRALRHSILLPDLDRSVRSILLTSAAPGEGKSTAIIHLAIAHAEQGKKTLIVDADLRRPSIHRKLNVNGSRGLSNALLGELNWRSAVVGQGQWPELWVLPAGTAPRRASDLIGSLMIDILDQAG